MALITGTLDASVRPTGELWGLGDGALLFYVPEDVYDMEQIVGVALPWAEISGTLDASVYATGVMVLTGVGTGNNRGLLDGSVRPVLVGEAENEYGRSGSAPDYSNPIIITSTAAGEGGTGTVVTGTLDASVRPNLIAGGIFAGEFTFFQAFPPQNLPEIGTAKLFGFIDGTLDAPITPTLTGVGQGNNLGLLNEIVSYYTLTGVAENEYGRSGSAPDYSNPIVITSTAAGEGGTGTVVTGTLDASVAPSSFAQGLVGTDAVQFYAAYPSFDSENTTAKEKVLIDGVLDKPINLALTGEGHGPTLGTLDENINYLTLVGLGTGNNKGQLSENINYLTLDGEALAYHGFLDESVNFLTLTGAGYGNNLGTLNADINLTLSGEANFEHDGTLDESIIITSNASGDVYHAYLDADIILTSSAAGEAVSPVLGDLDAFVTPSLTGVGHGPIEGVLDQSINFLTATALGEVIELIEGVLDESVNFITLDGAGYGNNLGTLDESVNFLTLDGEGKAFEVIDGVLDESVAPTLSGAGVSQYGRLNASVAPTLTGAGVSQYGRLVESVTPTLTAAGIVQYGRLDASVNNLTLSGAGFNNSKYHGDMTLPLLTLNSFLESDAKSAYLTLPKLLIEATAKISNNSRVDLTLPMLTLEAGDKGANLTLPSLLIESTMISGRVYNTDTTLPLLQSSGQLDGDYGGVADNTLPALTLYSNMIAGSGDVVMAGELPSLTMLSALAQGNDIEAALILPALEVDSVMFSELIIDAEMILPALRADAFIDNVGTLAVSAYSVNTENLELTEYSNYDFLSMAMFNGNPVGISATGIYELLGGDDAGTEIDASALFGFDDLGSANMKRMFYAYLGYKSDGEVEVQISIDGEPALRYYTVKKISGTTGIKRGRAKIAKGLRSRYWQVGIKNVAGSDLELDTLDLYIHETKRKVQ